MKYFGKKSLSSFLCIFFRFAWFGLLVCAIILGAYIFLYSQTNPIIEKIALFMKWDFQGKEIVNFKNMPIYIKLIPLPLVIALTILSLKMITKIRLLFINFTNEILFDKRNVVIISTISKLNIAISILSFNFYSLIISIFLFILCEIFKKGSELQEEHDFTV